MTVDWHVVGVYLVALEVEKQMVYKLLFVSVAREKYEPRKGARTSSNLSNTHCALLKTTAIESELHLNRFGAMTNAKFAGVIFVVA